MCNTFSRGKIKIKNTLPLESTSFFDHILKKYKLKDVYFFGFGNPYRSDDGFGIRIIERLRNIFPQNAFNENDLFEEKILDIINNEKNKLLLFFDVSNFSKQPGDIKVFKEEDLEDPKNDFHKIPVKLYMKLLRKNNNASYLIAVQPEKLEDTLENPQISESIVKTIDLLLIEIINKLLLPKKIKIDESKKYQSIIKENSGSLRFHSGYVVLNKNEDVGKHSTKNNEELLIILEGQGEVVVGEKAFNVERGNILYIPPEKLHNVKNKGNNKLKYIYVTTIVFFELLTNSW